MDKAESDGYIKLIKSSFTKIFEKEMCYAIEELKKMKQKKKRIDIKQLLQTNIYIFKENFKIIVSSCLD